MDLKDAISYIYSCIRMEKRLHNLLWDGVKESCKGRVVKSRLVSIESGRLLSQVKSVSFLKKSRVSEGWNR